MAGKDAAGASNPKKVAGERRAEIVRAAQEILAEEGPAALTLRAVANAVGIKLASLQYHFRTHADLVDALADETVAMYASGLEAGAASADASPEERLDHALRWFTVESPVDRRQAKLELQFWALAQTNDSAKEALRRYQGIYVETLRRLVRAARPNLSAHESRARALSIACLLEGAILFVDLADSPEEVRRGNRQTYESVRLLAFADAD